MSTVSRGVRNAFRNTIRTGSVIALLGISSALALALLLANQAVKTKTADLKKSAATTLTVNAAGAFGGEGGGEPLSTADLDKVKKLDHVSQVGAVMSSGGGMFRVFRGAGGESGATTTAGAQAPTSEVQLDSSIDPGTLGRRRFRASTGSDTATTEDPKTAEPAIKLPVMMTGLIGNLDRTGSVIKVTSGTGTFGAADVAEALVGKGLATKNNLKVGSTFTAYSTTFKVIGIFDAGNEFGNDGLYVPLATAQRLTKQPGEVGQIFVKADSIDNLAAVKTAVGNALGNTRVDITSPNQSIDEAMAALAGIQSIAFVGMLVSLGAAAVITFLIMVMIVRERRREIGVLKAIGGSNTTIVGQFVTEALVLTLCGAVVGVVLATVSSGAITGALVNANPPASSSGQTSGPGTFGGGPSGGAFRAIRIGGPGAGQTPEQLVSNIKTNVGLAVLGEGLLAAVLIAGLGSAIPAWLIAKVRPSEVLRGE